MADVSRPRVAAYVLREGAAWQLLVFEQAGHPEAGLQIPAGGVRTGETLAAAVLREVAEETGLTGLSIGRRLHTENSAHPATGAARTTTYFVVNAPPTSPDTWMHRVHGDGVDTAMIFQCRFQSLPLQHPLTDNQDSGLALIRPDFTTRTRQ